MKAVVIEKYGDASVLKIEDREKPKLKANEVLIKVCAAGVNRADIAQRKGNYPAPKDCVQDILGLEVSGEIIKLGKEVREFEKGDLVCALLAGGGYAEYVAVDAGSCLPIPKGISLKDAAGIAEALFTVWHNIFQRGNLKKDEKLLLYGASGGVGSMATQLCSSFGAKVFAMVSNHEKALFCENLGAFKTINYKQDKLLDQVGEANIDLILDCLGGQLEDNFAVLKKEGRLVYINAMEDGKTMLNIFQLMQKRISITGSTLRSRSNLFKKKLANDILQNAYPLMEQYNFKSMVNYKFTMAEVVQAHQLMESRNFMGKIILYW